MSDNLFLFANNNNGTAEDLGYYRLYNMLINEGETPIRDFQPVLDSNGVPCLMDKVNKKYYYDKNGKGFGCDGYSGVSYLKGDGNSWIDTGIISTNENDFKASVEFKIIETPDAWSSLFGSKYFSFKTYNHTINFELHASGQRANLSMNKKYNLTITTTQAIDNVTSDVLVERNGNIDATASTTSMKIFAGGTGGTLKGVQVYSFKLYKSDELVFDGIPVLDNEGTPCMYDLVTETFFYNQGTGTFSYGIEEEECPPVDYVGYIKNPRTEGVYNEFIKVPNMLFDETWKKIKAKYYTCTDGQNRLWEIFSGRFTLATNYGAFMFGYTNENGENKTLDFFRNVGIAPDNNTMMYFDIEWTPGNFNINGTNQTYEGIAQPQSSGVGRELRLCSNRMRGGMQYFTVYGENDVILLDLHACVDDNGVACVYDTIAKDFIYPVGTNPFTAEGGIIGYTPIKYIESNGTQYIDTGVVPTDNTDIDMVASAVEENALYLMNGLTIDTTYKFKETNTNVEPNLTASDGATLTLGSTYLAYLTEAEIEQAVKNGWTIQ